MNHKKELYLYGPMGRVFGRGRLVSFEENQSEVEHDDYLKSFRVRVSTHTLAHAGMAGYVRA